MRYLNLCEFLNKKKSLIEMELILNFHHFNNQRLYKTIKTMKVNKIEFLKLPTNKKKRHFYIYI